MEVKEWKYEDFPEFDESVEGAVVLDTTGDETGSHYTGQHVEYVNENGVPLHMEIITPFTRNNPEGVYPCVVFVQGSAWMEQDVPSQLPLLARLAERGYVVAIVEYRHSGIAPYPAQAVDARNAVRYIRVHAGELHVDPDQMILSGDSSGGHTAMFGGLLHNDDTKENHFPGISAEVNGIINFYGSVSVLFDGANPSTLNYKLPNSPEGMEMGGANLRERRDLCEELSVECHINEDTDIAPVLIFHGTKDRTVHTRQSVDLYRKMKAAGKKVQLYLVKGGDHGGAEFWTPEILDIVDAFIKDCFREIKVDGRCR